MPTESKDKTPEPQRKKINKNSRPNPAPKTDANIRDDNNKAIIAMMLALEDHVSSAQLVGTVVRNGKTTTFSLGFGDLMARIACADTFLREAEEALS